MIKQVHFRIGLHITVIGRRIEIAPEVTVQLTMDLAIQGVRHLSSCVCLCPDAEVVEVMVVIVRIP